MSKIVQKFSELMNQKREKLAKEYEKKIFETYPILKNDSSRYKEIESKFARENIDKKMEYYDLDCSYQLLQHIILHEVYLPFYDLTIALVDLKWLENLTEEFELSMQEKMILYKTFFKEVVSFFVPKNVRTYNLAIYARSEAKKKYMNGISYQNLFEETISWLCDPSINTIDKVFLEKMTACKKIRELLPKKGIEVIFEFPEMLKLFGLSESLSHSLNNYYNFNIKKETVYISVEKQEEKSLEKEVDKTLMKKQMQKYMNEEEFNGIIEGEDLKEFLNLANELYSSKRIACLKEKVLLNNEKLKQEKRLRILDKIMNDEDKEYYDFLCSFDRSDTTFLPYLYLVQDTIGMIENFIMDLLEEENEELILLYAEEIQEKFKYMRTYLSNAKQKS